MIMMNSIVLLLSALFQPFADFIVLGDSIHEARHLAFRQDNLNFISLGYVPHMGHDPVLREMPGDRVASLEDRQWAQGLSPIL